MRATVRTSVAVLVLALLAACSSSEPEQAAAPADTGPRAEEAVKAFYDHLNAGRHDEALALYTEQIRSGLQSADSGFADWAKSETHEGNIQNVEVDPVTLPGDLVTVRFAVHYKDGSTALRAVEVYRVGGVWELGSITPREG